MAEIQLGVVEKQFADMIWDMEPVSTSDLVKAAKERFGWARTTTYTVIHRLCNKELFVNEGGIVTSLISRDNFYTLQSRQFVNSAFDGSLPKFLAAFAGENKLTKQEADELRKMINEAE